ncbi:MAG: hypothetical protein LQ342_003592 [Letrouitia transgressa]|nr:MAG: hypothetical protein LQ342_003592 [Letrouitia transgressa]
MDVTSWFSKGQQQPHMRTRRSSSFELSPEAVALMASDNEPAKDGGVATDVEMEGLSLYEKKALLVNRELDSHGMGRYQWHIWGLCGLGYMIDLLYAQAFGLVAPALQQELGFSGNLLVLCKRTGTEIQADSEYGNIFSSFNAGLCAGNRRFLLALLSVFQPIGVVVASGIAYGFVPKYACGNGGLGTDGEKLAACSKVVAGQPCCTKSSNMGWRYLLFTLGAICLFVFFMRFVVFRFQESPKYLLYRGEDKKAVRVLHNIAKTNGRRSAVTMEIFAALTDEDESVAARNGAKAMIGAGDTQRQKPLKAKLMVELSRYKILFASVAIARLTILIWVTYMFDYWGFSIAGSLLPKILLEKDRAIEVSTAETYRNYVIIYICGIPGVLLGALMYGVPFVGRKWAMVGSSALMGASLFLFSSINTEASNIGLNIMEYFFQSMFNSVLYGWTPEAYPAPIRGTACGVASFWGRLFSIVSPLIGAHLLASNANGPLYLAGAGVFVCTFCILLMPTRYMGSKSF